MFLSPMTQTAKKHYWRSDITGLRALAVLPVVLYHAFPNLIPGGFVGVDIFFVISGYLISGILFRNLQEEGRIDFWDFYQKRILRILPNLILLLLAVAVLGYLLLIPSELSTLGKHIYSSAGFYQNFRLLSEVDYFDAASLTKPLLHLWSLAIEEQFYLVFPAVCALLWRLTKSAKALGCWVVFLVLASFSGCLLDLNKSHAFYFPLTRFWELGAGIVLAYAETYTPLRKYGVTFGLRRAASWLGLLLIVAAMTFFGHGTPFPGAASLLPVVGAVLIILGGIGEGAPVVNRVLGWSPVVFVGLISYSLYLWHWPLISFLHIALPEHSISVILAVLAVSVLVSVFVYGCVENPVRRLKGRKVRIWVSMALLAGLVLCIALGQTYRKSGVPVRVWSLVSSEVNVFAEHHQDRKSFDDPVFIQDDKEVWRYRTYETGGAPDYVFAGDSHMTQYGPRLARFAREGARIMVTGGSSCLPARGLYDAEGPRLSCSRIVDDYEKALASGKVKAFVVAGIWGGYIHNTSNWFETPNGRQTLEDGGFDEVMRRLRALPEKYPEVKFYAVLDVPWDSKSYDLCNRLNRFDRELSAEDFLVPFPEEQSWLKGNEAVRKALGDVYEIIDPVPSACPDERCLLLNYMDANHLRASYVRDHAIWIDRIFK